ncbi:MAG: alpha-amylase [Pirellula sp.]|nr:alpha-amylase [Pirellula sp.]
MSSSIRLALVLHNHQPVGNFDAVIEQAYQESYKPFLDVFADYAGKLKLSLHTSGCLMEWLAVKHPEYLDRLAEFAAAGSIEIVGGAFYEAILPMIPRRDRIGQIRTYTAWLERRLGCKVRGMWMPERVWEQSLVSEIAAAGIEYTVLDDFHFKNAGLLPHQLHGSYVTEDDGRILAVFPGSERLRYLIPFSQPHESIDYLRSIAAEHPGAVVVFGDDGEKFGTWPDTYRHVYTDGWLRRFFDQLVENASWLHTTTLGEAIDAVPPLGKAYLPDASYREMTEWVLPTERLLEYEQLSNEMEKDPHWPQIKQFIRGGFWRNFKVKYPETDEMYSRMMMISSRLEEAFADGLDRELLEQARTELYRGQCNCAYWHGAFGGIYLPHLRNAIYTHLIAADNLLHKAVAGSPAQRGEPWIEAAHGDFNCDARQEIYLANDKLAALISPHRGGSLYELDVRSICQNLLSTLARRPEAYHRKVLAGTGSKLEGAKSIHSQVIFKQPDLDKQIRYDAYQRKAMQDHFFDDDATLAMAAANEAMERGDFLNLGYEAKLLRNPHRIQARLSRDGNAWGVPLKITKGFTMEAGSGVIDVAYMIEGLPPGRSFHFGVEFNVAGLPSGCDDRYFHDGRHNRLGHLGSKLDLAGVRGVNLVDEWLGIDVGLRISEPSSIWTFPIESVSQSEGGFELVHQSIVVMPHWHVVGDAAGRWSVTMQLAIDTSQAESRMEKSTQAAIAATV